MTRPLAADPLLLAIDLGTSSVKVLAVTKAGAVVGRGEAGYPIDSPQPGHAEQNPADWWAATCMAVRAAVAKLEPRRIAAIGLSGQMHGTVLLDRQGHPLAPAVIWPDQRSRAEVETLTAAVGPAHLIELTGSPVATGFQAATLAWVRRHRPELWQTVRHVLLPKDYLRYRLTDRFASDPSDAAGTLLLDVRQRTWAVPLLAEIGIEPAWLPPIQPATTVAGEMSVAAAAELGVPVGTPVITGAADTPCSALGAGAVTPETLLVTLSTGGQLLLPRAEVAVDLQGRIHTFCSALEPGAGRAGWYQMAALLAAGLAWRWLRDRVFGLEGADAYSTMNAWAEQAPPGADGLLFLPYLVGERTPHMDPRARGLFLGLTLAHGRSHLARAVLEGVSLAAYDAYRVLAELGAQPARLVLAGGGARSPLWRQIVADVFGQPLLPLAVDGQSALGAALLAGAGIGLFDLVETAQRWAAYGAPVEPDAARHALYQARLPLFRQAYRQNRALFAELGGPP